MSDFFFCDPLEDIHSVPKKEDESAAPLFIGRF
jgi:hypothetical protein